MATFVAAKPSPEAAVACKGPAEAIPATDENVPAEPNHADPAASDEASLVAEARGKLAELDDLQDFFFSARPGEKAELLGGLASEILALLDGLGPGATAPERAAAALLRGRALDAMEGQAARAEEWLGRAVKLNPLSVEAWNAMGHGMWKRSNTTGAKHCFERALELGENAASLRQLSMLLRALRVDGPEKQIANVEESLELARRAVALDVRDPASWYALGNAWCAVFFKKSHRFADLKQALKAYSRADATGGEHNPDLHLNRGNVLCYLEDFHEAVTNYNVAKDLDPGLRTEEQVADLERFVRRAADLVQRKGRVKAKKLARMRGVLAAAPVPAALGNADAGSLDALEEGVNPGKLLALQVLMPLSSARCPPETFLVMDAAGECATLSMYDTKKAEVAGIGEGSMLQVSYPVLRTIDYHHNGLQASFRSVSVTNPATVYLDGTAMTVQLDDATFGNFTG